MSNEDLFEGIQVGDTVLISKAVSIGYFRTKRYLVPEVVDRVTPKQFQIKGVRYRKKDGVIIGQDYSGCAYKEGEKINRYEDEVYTNELEQYKEALACRNAYNSIVASCNSLEREVKENSLKLDHASLIETASLLKKAEQILKKRERNES
jgi:hypothetical protein